MPRLRVADRGLREGMLVKMMREDGVWDGGNRRRDRMTALLVAARATSRSGSRAARAARRPSRRWLERQLNDPYVARAKREGLRSRAAFKLIEIDDKEHMFKPGGRVVDLGAAPGGWSQMAAKRVGAAAAGDAWSRSISCEMTPIAGVDFMQLDFLDPSAPDKLKAMLGGPADVVLSDMAANATGHAKTDHLKIMALVETAADLPARC